MGQLFPPEFKCNFIVITDEETGGLYSFLTWLLFIVQGSDGAEGKRGSQGPDGQKVWE